MPRNFAFASVGGLFHFGAQESVAVDRVIDSDGRRCDEPPAPYPSRGVVRLRLQYLMTFALPRGTQRGGAFCLYAAIVQPTKWGATSAGTRRLPTSAPSDGGAGRHPLAPHIIAERIQHRIVADVAGPRKVPRSDWKGSGWAPCSGPSTCLTRHSTPSKIIQVDNV